MPLTISVGETNKLGLKIKKGEGLVKTVNLKVKLVRGLVSNATITIRDWLSPTKLNVA